MRVSLSKLIHKNLSARCQPWSLYSQANSYNVHSTLPAGDPTNPLHPVPSFLLMQNLRASAQTLFCSVCNQKCSMKNWIMQPRNEKVNMYVTLVCECRIPPAKLLQLWLINIRHNPRKTGIKLSLVYIHETANKRSPKSLSLTHPRYR